MSYPGGKSGAGVYQTLINLMPPHTCYCEPFLGGGAVMRAKAPARINIGVELDRTALKQAMDPIGAPWQNLRIEKGHGPSWKVFRDKVHRFEFLHGNGIDVLERQKWPETTVIYCDPPYLLSARRDPKGMYDHEMTDEDHRRLLGIIRKLSCRVIISGYSSPMYAKELRGWNATSFQVQTRGRGRPAAEWVWFNFDKPMELHDYRYLGDNYRQRWHLSRMKKRWVEKLKAMPPLKRQALLAAIADTAGKGEGTR